MKEEEEQGKPPTSPTTLQRSTVFINSLISSSSSIQSFPVKWQLIRKKLEKLNSGLIAATTVTDDLKDNFELEELLQDITTVVNQTQLLADQCLDDSYDGGKLLLRSNLDVITSRLDVYIKRLDDIYASGILMHSQAIILSKPGACASCEDMRLYVKDVFSRLRVGGSKLRSQALVALNEVLSEDEKYVKIVVGEMADGISLLVSLVEFGDISSQEEASEALSVIAKFETYRGVLATAGVVGPLIKLLDTGSELAKQRAAQTLKRMTENSENSWAVSAQGGATTLLKLCDDCNNSTELVDLSCGVVRNLSGVAEIKRFMVEEGAVSVFAKLLRSREEVIQIQAIEFLANLASENETVKQRVVREVIEPLVHVLEPNSVYSSKAREVALRAIDSFCFSSPDSVRVLMVSGFLNWLLFFLRNGEISVQESTLKAVFRLSGVSEEAKKAMGDLGFMSELVKLLEVRSFGVREMSAEALSSLISIQRNRRKFAQEEHNVNRILQLLDPDEEKLTTTKNFLLSSLLSLTDSNTGKKKILASRYVKNLEKLAASDVTDAKKIIKKLSSNRFRTILNGIWSS